MFIMEHEDFDTAITDFLQAIGLDGCLEIEAMYPLAREAHVAERFVKTCTDWTLPWINDRIFPYRPFIYMPRATQIDATLRKCLPEGLFDQIIVG